MSDNTAKKPLMNNPGALFVTAAATILVGFYITVSLPFKAMPSHGSGPFLTIDNPLVLKGQEVYRQEGCQYCHTKNLRPFSWEVKRFSDEEKLGFFPLEEPMEYYFEAPYTKGSMRIGPDLSRLATKMDADQLKSYLSAHVGRGDEASMSGSHHQFARLFRQEYGFWDGVAFSWRVRAMMQAGTPLNEPFQRAGLNYIPGNTRGDALVAYLMSLGKEKMQFAGNFYQ